MAQTATESNQILFNLELSFFYKVRMIILSSALRQSRRVEVNICNLDFSYIFTELFIEPNNRRKISSYELNQQFT